MTRGRSWNRCLLFQSITTHRSLATARNQNAADKNSELWLTKCWASCFIATFGRLALQPSVLPFDRSRLPTMNPAQIAGGREQLIELLNPAGPEAPARLQTSVVSGHKADFGADAARCQSAENRRASSALDGQLLGPAIVPTYSFTSITEVSEYVPTLEQYGKRLVEEGEQLDSPAYKAKLKAYENREVMMRTAAAHARLAAVAIDLLLSDEQKAESRRELVPAAVFRTQPIDGRTWPHRHDLRRQSDAANHRLDRLRRLGMGRDAVGPQSAVFERYRLHDAVRRSQCRYAEFGPFYVSYVTTPARCSTTAASARQSELCRRVTDS